MVFNDSHSHYREEKERKEKLPANTESFLFKTNSTLKKKFPYKILNMLEFFFLTH